MPALSTALGLLLVLVLPVAALYRRTHPEAAVGWRELRRGLALQWTVTLLLLAFVATTSVDVLDAFGGTGGDLVLDAMAAFVLVGVFGLGASLGARLYRRVPMDSVTRTLMALSIPRKLTVAITAAVTEELLLRGFLITQLEALGVGTVVAAVAAVIAGVLAHAARRSTGRLVLTIPLQTAFVLAFVVTGNVLACIVAHLAYDAIVLLTGRQDDRTT